jgi:dUTPase
VVLINLGERPFAIDRGTPIAQLVFAHHGPAVFVSVAALGTTDRRSRAFGADPEARESNGCVT